MGACATKPKVKTSDGTDREAPAPVPEPVKDEPATGAGGVVDAVVLDDHEGKEKKEVVVVNEADEKKKVVEGDDDHYHGGAAAADDGKIKEVVDDEQASKRRSLSHLFKENEDGKDSTENSEKTPSDDTAIVKPEPLPSDTEYLTAGESGSTKVPEPAPEVKDSETVVEEIIPVAIEVNKSSNAPEEKSKTEEVIEAAPADDSETHDDKVTILLEKYREEKELENQNIETAPASETTHTHDDKVKIILDKFREGEEEEKTTVDVKENNQENAKV